jgi:hypothetical protein
MKKRFYLDVLKSSILLLGISLFVGCGETSGNDCCDKVTAIQPFSTQIVNPSIGKDINKTQKIKELGEFEEEKPTNIPPRAIANGDIGLIKITKCGKVSFVGSDSNDSDGNITSYTWIDSEYNVLSNNANFERRFYSKGIYEKTLIVVDDKNATGLARVCVLVNMDEDDIPLIAIAGKDQNIVEDDSITLEGHAKCRASQLSYKWIEDGNVISDQAVLTKSDFSIGTHILTLEITDENYNYSHSDLTLTVNPK